jgi:hypothetical protein
VTYYGFAGSSYATLTVNTSLGVATEVIAVSWTEEVDTTPTYSLSIDSGRTNYPTVGDETTYNTFTYTVDTTNVPNGTVLYWTTTTSVTSFPADAADLNGMQGTFTINNNQGSFTRTVVADETTEDTEYFGTEIRTTSYSGPRVAQGYVGIQDTSKTPAPVQPQTYDPTFYSPATVTRGVRFDVAIFNGAPNTTWTATNGITEVGGTFDANGNWSGDFVIDAVGSFTFTVSYSDPTSATDTVVVRCVDPLPDSNDTPANISPQQKVVTIPFDGRRHISTGSTTITNASNETLNFSVYCSSKPVGSSVGILPTSFTLGPGANRTISFAGNCPANDSESYEYIFAIVAAGYDGAYPEFSLLQFRDAEGAALP